MTYPNVYAAQTGPLALSSLDANFLYAVDIANGALSATAGGTADAITATYSPAPAALVAGLTLYVRAASANATTTPQFSPNGLTGKVIVKNNNQALAVGDIAGAGHWLHLVYDATNGVWELINPATSASVVLTGGTANGVAYLNASKVLTTGNALTFDGTSLTSSGFSGPLNGTVGATTANTGSFTTLSASSTVSGTGFSTYLASPPAIGGTAAAAGSFTTLGASGSVTLSGGTANGVAYLNGSKVLTTGSALTFDGTNFATTGTATATKLIPTGSSVTGNGLYLPATNSLGLSTNGTNAVYIDSSQNVGIGTTSPAGKLQVTGSFAAGTVGNYPAILGGGNFGGGIGFQDGTGVSGIYTQSSGTQLLFFTGQTSTDTASSKVRMTIDGSGNVGIGTSSPGNKLVTASNATNSKIEIQNTSTAASTSKTSALQFTGTDTTGTLKDSGDIYVTPSDNNYVGSNMLFYTRISDTTAERMRIDSSGNLLVGTTSNLGLSGLFAFKNASGAVGSFSCANGATAIGFGNQSGTATYNAIYFYTNAFGTNVGSIAVNSGSTSYNTTSDYRLKENILPMTGALAKVQLLKPVTYKWKSDGSDAEGFVAHELAEVCPHAVTGEKDAVDEDDKPKYQQIDVSFLVATLTAAIQELKALTDTQASTITALTARITALEAK